MRFKKLPLIALSVLFSATTLSGCKKEGTLNPEYSYFIIRVEFEDARADYYRKFLVDGVLKQSKESFYDSLLKELFENQLLHYDFNGITYSNGDPFEFGEENIKNYLNNSVKNHTYDRWEYGRKYDTYTWNLTVLYSPTKYNITYLGYESDTTFDEYRKYDCTNHFDLPKVDDNENTECKGWKDISTNVIYESTNDISYKDVTVEPVVAPRKYNIDYNIPIEGVENPNPDSYDYLDESITLKPIADDPLGGYFFRGWYLDKDFSQSITSINPADGLQSYTLYANIEIPTYTAKYYVDGTLVDTKTLTYPELESYEEPTVPGKDHYVNARWSTSVARYADYEINALYDKESYVITILDNASKNIEPKTLEYLDTYEELYSELDALAGENESFIGLFKDSAHVNKVEATSEVDSSATLYAYYEQIVHLKTYEDLLTIDPNFKGTYVLDNDISCVGDALPYLDHFDGVLDGNGHSIKRFSNTSVNSGKSCALFGVNNGVIKNITFEQGTFVLKNSPTYGDFTFGMIASTNKGTISNVDIKGANASFSPTFNIYISARTSVTTLFFAGLVAGINEGEIYNCEVDSDSTVEFISSITYTRDDGVEYPFYCLTYFGALVGSNRAHIKNVTSSAYVKQNKLSISENIADYQDKYFTSVTYRNAFGGVSGVNDTNGVIENAVSNAHIESTYNLPGDMKKPLYSSNHVGGICGYNVGNIKCCYTSDTTLIHSYAYADQKLGGIAGSNADNGKVKSCYSYASFKSGHKYSSDSTYRMYIGGVIGFSSAQMNYCYASVASITHEVPGTKFGSLGGLIGYAENNSSSTYCFGYLNLAEEYILTSNKKDYASTGLSAIFSNVAMCVPEQLTAIEHVEGVKEIESMEKLIEQAALYYFDEAGFTLSDSALPTIPGIGKLAE